MADSTLRLPALLVDCCGPENHLVWLGPSGAQAQRSFRDPVLSALAQNLRQLFQATGRQIAEVESVIYVHGPGSTLGLRLAALFLRSLRQLGQFPRDSLWELNRLEWMAFHEWTSGANTSGLWVAPWSRSKAHAVEIRPDSGRATFHRFSLEAGDPRFARASAFPLGNRALPLEKFAQSDLPPLPRLIETLLQTPELLSPSATPTPYMPAEPQFARWDARPHSAP
jgi:hypothetical protein